MDYELKCQVFEVTDEINTYEYLVECYTNIRNKALWNEDMDSVIQCEKIISGYQDDIEKSYKKLDKLYKELLVWYL